jgi:RluA family pseudouridine synthase
MDLERGATVFEIGAAHAGLRLDRFLCQRIPALSRAQIQRAIGERVRLERQADPKPSTRLRPGDRVLVGFPSLVEDEDELARIRIPVLWEDEWLLAVDKPAGLVVHPTQSAYRASVIMHLRRSRTDGAALTLVHRLDRETSGVLLLAKGSQAAAAMQRRFLGGEMCKRYLALVSPPLSLEAGVLDLPLARDPLAMRRCRQQVDPGGAPARTEFRVLRRWAEGCLVELTPRTGRQHQIRVHLEAAGSPVLGDRLYGAGRAPDAQRHLLHAAEVEFPHPADGKPVRIRALLPPDMQAYLGEIPTPN